jgi:DNA-binding NarL/FixJ family response regulator
VAVDTNLLVSDIEALRARLRALNKPPLAILVTHPHPDHFNGVFRKDVATLVVDGLADREIAEQLHLSHHTVSQYVKRIYRKLGVSSRVGLTSLVLGCHGDD